MDPETMVLLAEADRVIREVTWFSLIEGIVLAGMVFAVIRAAMAGMSRRRKYRWRTKPL